MTQVFAPSEVKNNCQTMGIRVKYLLLVQEKPSLHLVYWFSVTKERIQ